MNNNKIFLAALIFLIIFPISKVVARDADYEFKDRIDEGRSLFFLVELEEDEEIEIEIEPYGNGYYHLFLFDERPEKTHVNIDKTLDNDINDNKVAHDKGKSPDINYTAEDDQIYYVQVILTKNGPDTFTLKANRKLSRYYLPQIPSYPLEILIISIIFSVGLLILLINRKNINDGQVDDENILQVG